MNGASALIPFGHQLSFFGHANCHVWRSQPTVYLDQLSVDEAGLLARMQSSVIARNVASNKTSVVALAALLNSCDVVCIIAKK
jgi:hypothetical protein